MRKNTIRKTIYGAYAYPVPLAVRLERHSRNGYTKQAWNIYTTPGKYRINAEMKHTYKKPLPGCVWLWADLVNALIYPAGDLYTVDSPDLYDTMSRAELLEMVKYDLAEIAKLHAERGEKI